MARIKRDAFLYLDGKKADFAQCSSCCFFDQDYSGSYAGKCALFKKEVDGDDTCGMYVPGPFSGISNAKRVTPEEAGFLKDTSVRCENCRYGGGGVCRLFEMLNRRMPKTFELDTKISPKSCCNAWRKK
jgi:hypothetical protein